jgi:anti-anti-sigma regulatory factor
MKPEFLIKKQKTGGVKLTAKGDLTIKYSFLFKEILTKLISKQGDVKICLQEIQSLDISAIQLLSAFHKMLKATNRKFSIAWSENEEVNELLVKSGIQQAFNQTYFS